MSTMRGFFQRDIVNQPYLLLLVYILLYQIIKIVKKSSITHQVPISACLLHKLLKYDNNL